MSNTQATKTLKGVAKLLEAIAETNTEALTGGEWGEVSVDLDFPVTEQGKTLNRIGWSQNARYLDEDGAVYEVTDIRAAEFTMATKASAEGLIRFLMTLADDVSVDGKVLV